MILTAFAVALGLLSIITGGASGIAQEQGKQNESLFAFFVSAGFMIGALILAGRA